MKEKPKHHNVNISVCVERGRMGGLKNPHINIIHIVALTETEMIGKREDGWPNESHQ